MPAFLIEQALGLQVGDGMEGGLVAAMLSMLGLEEKDVKDSDKLASFGVDSMQLAEIRSRLQRAMGRPIPLEEVSNLSGSGLLT